MGKIAALSGLIVLLSITGADAAIVELPLGAEGRYDVNSGPWEMDFDLGVAFTEISNVYIDWSGEITGGLATDPWVPGPQPFPFNEGIDASLGGEPFKRRATISGGKATYPEPEVFDCRSEFELLGSTTWSDLLDGQGTISLGYSQLVSGSGSIIEYGFVILNEAILVVDGTPVPEPATVIFLALGVLGLCTSRPKR